MDVKDSCCTTQSLLFFSILGERVLRNGLAHAFPFFLNYSDNIHSGKILRNVEMTVMSKLLLIILSLML